MMQFAFQAVSKDTLADNAVLNIKEVPLKMKCRGCAKELTFENDTFVCPNCQSRDLDLIEGREVIIESVEGDK